MSILQEYENIKKQIGDQAYEKINSFLDLHKNYLLSDVFYNEQVYGEFENWCKSIDEIYMNILSGKTYGRYIKPSNPVLKSNIYSAVLSADDEYIYWCNYGSSATKNTKEYVLWIITHIFELTPEAFIKKFVCE